MNKNNLLVTLADKNYIKQAKQLFSSVYHNAGWKGDYMLLSHQIPEKGLSWFKDKGILIKRCQPLSCLKDWQNKEYPSCVFDKFYLFQKEFKKWDKIVFLDADIIVRASLEKLTEVKGFRAVEDEFLFNENKEKQFRKQNKTDKKIFKKLKAKYNLKKPTFNSGVFAFSTDIIKKKTFSDLKLLLKKYKRISIGEQGILNIFLEKKWKKIPSVFNVYIKKTFWKKENFRNIKGIILHFNDIQESMKPWNPKNYFYKEWKGNLNKANLININKNQQLTKKWSNTEIITYSLFLKIRFLFLKLLFNIDKIIGKIGLFLKKNYPNLYSKIKRRKDFKE